MVFAVYALNELVLLATDIRVYKVAFFDSWLGDYLSRRLLLILVEPSIHILISRHKIGHDLFLTNLPNFTAEIIPHFALGNLNC
jgi:hypothetical protein